MKIKSFDHSLRYFFTPRIHGHDSSDKLPELVKPDSEWERGENAIEDILRWADDGGQMLDLGNRNRTARLNSERAGERANER
jgi:hypothetical protein